ncbi:hypothetical protein [Myxococcus sp. AS-1-15]|uniref:hypothetical protein n=1 Tax=Myxococcus sp. AS-1-15 TaxID=2874600 RepID=UPI001CBE16E9|nr:hypothetical protein [Myxococcus sp. AS-1-15]MBZ4402420.1 hypothetical protein [Myxococcus sp. AS-1-15]
MNADNFRIYVVPPIDFGWETLLVADKYDDTLCALLQRARAQTSCAWEGDFMQGPGKFAIPMEGSFAFGYAWKQANDGTTFVASPVQLPWMERLDFQRIL